MQDPHGGRMARAFTTLAVLLAFAAPARAQDEAGGLSRDAMLGFLAQCLFTDEAGQPILPDGKKRPCTVDQLQDLDAPGRWRKHDQGAQGDDGADALGYQISDSVLDRRSGRDVVVQTFDFGDGNRRFRRFDKGEGDGGDLVALVDGSAYGILTEDGGNGLQWFVGEACRTGEPDGRLKSWLFFGADVRRDQWRDAVARLNIARSADACPTQFGSAYTRYRRVDVTVPFRITDRDGHVSQRRTGIDTVVSEHYGRDTIATADHLERFFFGRDLGKYRWERWEQRDRSLNAKAGADAAILASSGRCRAMPPHSDSPGPGWLMVDCRTWTNLVWETRPWAVRDYGWPDVDPFGGAR